jgi:hypothetical protein
MSLTAKFLVIVTCLLLVPILSMAQIDPFGVPDTVYAEIARIDDFNYSITISYFNDEDVVGIAVPFKMSAGLNKIVADSATYTGGRVENWNLCRFRADTAIQCVTLGMIASLGPNDIRLGPGSGRLATVFVSSLENKKIEEFSIDTTTTHPDNYLMVVAAMTQGEPPDTVRVDFQQRQMMPAWVVRDVEYADPKAE